MRLFHSRDYAEVVRWYKAWGEEAWPFDTLPVVGLIVPGVAAAWLLRTDSSVAIMEGLITNPAASLRARSKATTEIILGLERTAKEEGFRYVLASTKRQGVARRACRLGFKEVGQFAMMTKAL